MAGGKLGDVVAMLAACSIIGVDAVAALLETTGEAVVADDDGAVDNVDADDFEGASEEVDDADAGNADVADADAAEGVCAGV